MASESTSDLQITEKELRRWRLIEDFRLRLAQAVREHPLHRSWADPDRLLSYDDYLSLFLFGLLNPVVRTMRGLCAASGLKRVQAEVCSRRVSLGSFSEAQRLLDPALLQPVFSQLAQQVQAKTPGPAGRQWHIQDSSLFNALPRMYWALWRRQGKSQSQVRLHLSLDITNQSPARASVTTGRGCERATWRDLVQPGDGYVADRYYSEDYQLLGELDEAKIAFVVRLRESAAIHVEQELALSAEDQKAKVLDDARVQLGCKTRCRAGALRLVRVQTEKEVLLLLTNLSIEELSAAEVALLYKQRWQVELFFRWIKYIFGCRHWLAESPQGAAIEIYLALIGALLLQLYTGERPNRRMFELIQLYLLGVAELEELCAGVQQEHDRLSKVKKSKKS